jgi:hypothetical protein
MEIGIGGWFPGTGFIFDSNAIEWCGPYPCVALPLRERAMGRWDRLCADGYHLTPVGGSDDHKGGVNETILGVSARARP